MFRILAIIDEAKDEQKDEPEHQFFITSIF